MCRRRGLKLNAGKSKVMVMNGEEGLGCEVYIDEDSFRAWAEISNILDVFWTNQVQTGKNVIGRWRVGKGCRCHYVPS